MSPSSSHEQSVEWYVIPVNQRKRAYVVAVGSYLHWDDVLGMSRFTQWTMLIGVPFWLFLIGLLPAKFDGLLLGSLFLGKDSGISLANVEDVAVIAVVVLFHIMAFLIARDGIRLAIHLFGKEKA